MVAHAVEPCGSVFDTGSDHAFVPVYLVMNGTCRTAVASDVKDGPLRVSGRNIRRFGLSEEIKVEKGYGIENAGGHDCIVIAGMGGQLIRDILERNPSIAEEAGQLVLQPMNAPEKLRKYLWDSGYGIYYESLCSEKHKVYNVICARYMGLAEKYENWQLHSSKYLVEHRHPLIPGYLAPKLRRLRDMRDGMADPSEALSALIHKLEELSNEDI